MSDHPKSKEAMAEYQRQRRAKIRAMANQTASPAEAIVARTMLRDDQDDLVAKILADDPSLRNIPRRDNLRNEQSDGMADTTTLIQNMTQWQRDQILGKLPMTKARPR